MADSHPPPPPQQPRSQQQQQAASAPPTQQAPNANPNSNANANPTPNPSSDQAEQQEEDDEQEANPPAPPPVPGPRAARLQALFAAAANHSLDKISMDNFAACFPTVAVRAPGTLEFVQRKMVERLGDLWHVCLFFSLFFFSFLVLVLIFCFFRLFYCYCLGCVLVGWMLAVCESWGGLDGRILCGCCGWGKLGRGFVEVDVKGMFWGASRAVYMGRLLLLLCCLKKQPPRAR